MIRIENLRAGYDGVERLRGISCELPAGKLTALVGPNGCGKSTLMKCMAGVLKPMDGKLFIGGSDYSALSPRELARMAAYMPQSRPAPEISVRQLTAHGRYPHLTWGRSLSRKDHEIIEDSMQRAGAAEFADRNVSALSGGERQRAYLSMMLAQQAQILLLDEPTTYLDPGSQFELMDMLSALRDEGKTVVAVLHDLSLALEYADHIALMRAGTLVQLGAPAEIYASGRLSDVFGVDVERTPGGKYVFSRKRRENHEK